MSILSISLSVPTSTQKFSSLNSISGRVQPLFIQTNSSTLRFETMEIRMGGGPRTYPGGVSKWQWKRMQANKAKQLLKARLARERQIYEMRKRAELKAAVSELERPWEVVEKAPNLFSVTADEQLKVLADRFQRPGGFDMWSDCDGPELFKPSNGLPSARFFPKGVVHSVKPYGKIENYDSKTDQRAMSVKSRSENNGDVVDVEEKSDRVKGRHLGDVSVNNRIAENSDNARVRRNRSRENDYKNKYSRNSAEGGESTREQSHQKRYSTGSAEVGYRVRNRRGNLNPRQNVKRVDGLEKSKDLNLDVYDMSLRQGGIYKLEAQD